jgi:hypothetical protein
MADAKFTMKKGKEGYRYLWEVGRDLPGKGQRLVIPGVRYEMGWIPNTKLIYCSKKNTGNCHDEMTGNYRDMPDNESQ